MKRVVRIHRQGKVRTVRRRALAALPAVDDQDSLIALIQALIPLGLQAVYKTLEDEVTALAQNMRKEMRKWDKKRGHSAFQTAIHVMPGLSTP